MQKDPDSVQHRRQLWYCTKLQGAPCDIFVSKCNPKKSTSELAGNTAEITGADRTMTENISVFKLRGLLETFLEDKTNLNDLEMDLVGLQC